MSCALLYTLSRHLRLGVPQLGGVALKTFQSPHRIKFPLVRSTQWGTFAHRSCSNTSSQGPHDLPHDLEEYGTRTRNLTRKTHQDNTLPDLQEAAEKEFLLPSQKQKYESDLLLVRIRDCQDTAGALAVYKRHKDVVNTRHALALMQKFQEFVASGAEDCSELLRASDFEDLCHQLFIASRRMEVEELVALLKHLCRLEVPAASKLTQTVLQMLKSQINDLTLRQLIFLDFLLKKLPLTSLSDALRTAIPILLNNALTSPQLAELSLADLTQAFTICCDGKVDRTGAVLMEIYQRGSVSGVQGAMNVVWALTRLALPRQQQYLLNREELLTREVLMKENLDMLARDLGELNDEQVEATLTKVCEAFERRDRSCYNEHFLHAVAMHFTRHPHPFVKVAHIIRKLMNMNFLSEGLTRYTVDLIMQNPTEVPVSKAGMLPVISAVAASSLPLEKVMAALDTIMTHRSLNLDSEDYIKKPLLVVAVDLLSAGYFHPPLMDIFTSADTLSIFMSKYPKNDINHRRLLEIDRALGEIFQSHSRVPEMFLEPGRALAKAQLPTRSVLKALLQQILQDPGHVVSGVLTENHMYIDHLLVLDAAGIPIKLRSPDVPLIMNPDIATLDVPKDATRVAILDVGSSHVFKPANTPKGLVRLRQKILEVSGYKVVLMVQPALFQHQQEEKFLYVKRELEEAGVVFR